MTKKYELHDESLQKTLRKYLCWMRQIGNAMQLETQMEIEKEMASCRSRARRALMNDIIRVKMEGSWSESAEEVLRQKSKERVAKEIMQINERSRKKNEKACLDFSAEMLCDMDVEVDEGADMIVYGGEAFKQVDEFDVECFKQVGEFDVECCNSYFSDEELCVMFYPPLGGVDDRDDDNDVESENEIRTFLEKIKF